MAEARWIDLAGAANVRDLGGLPTDDGRTVLPRRLIRADNLQGLTRRDVRVLVDEYDVRAIADLRSATEVRLEGQGPMTREPAVRIEHLSLFPEFGMNTDAAVNDDSEGPPILPWQTDEAAERRRSLGGGAEGVYAGYLADRGGAVVDALRLIATTDGAALVHCAAGKDRTGVVVATALAEVGVRRAEIVADYARSAERIEAIFDRLRASSTYGRDMAGASTDRHRPRAETMQRLLELVDRDFGGIPAWLRGNGWIESDAGALRAHLLGASTA